MEFRAPTIATQQNVGAIEYLTKNLSDPLAGKLLVADLFNELGNAVEAYPVWHPILTAQSQTTRECITSLQQVKAFDHAKHTQKFVKGFVSCSYSEARADQLVDAVQKVSGLLAYRVDGPLYADETYPVAVLAHQVELEADGTIRSRDALAWFAQQQAKDAHDAEVAETWWNVRSLILGRPHGSRSSLFVNQHAGNHMRKILEAMNDSGMFGPILEDSLAMLSAKKRTTISETLIRTAMKKWDKVSNTFEFELCGETCTAKLRDTFDDGEEISIRVEIGNVDLSVSGFYDPKSNRLTHSDPCGKRKLAEKFL